jgi:hypothetical protein
MSRGRFGGGVGIPGLRTCGIGGVKGKTRGWEEPQHCGGVLVQASARDVVFCRAKGNASPLCWGLVFAGMRPWVPERDRSKGYSRPKYVMNRRPSQKLEYRRRLRIWALDGAVICGWILNSLLVWPASADEESTPPIMSVDAQKAPFLAAVRKSFARVHLRPETDSPEVGLLREGATVTVRACQPDCASPHAWALLGTDGAVKLALLDPRPIRSEGPTVPNPEGLWYGRVGKSAIRIYKQPRLGGPILARNQMNLEMAFLPNVDLQRKGWLERVEGGFVRTAHVHNLRPSRFQGEVRPHLPLAFMVRDLRPTGNSQDEKLHRYDRILVRKIDRVSVMTDSGPLPRKALRIVTPHSPPPLIPRGAKWVFVDLEQQTLTAYEGETPVYATLISSGKDHNESETHAGLYRVEHKMVYSDMHGQPLDPYVVDRVPYVLYFHKNEALHGTYWHDRFGWPASHGCVNLALADAHWLFDWAPPRLPEAWTTIDPKAAGLTSLWVLIRERATP